MIFFSENKFVFLFNFHWNVIFPFLSELCVGETKKGRRESLQIVETFRSVGKQTEKKFSHIFSPTAIVPSDFDLTFFPDLRAC